MKENVSHILSSVEFSMYSEVESLSALKITCGDSFDAFGMAVKNGLYDLRLGAQRDNLCQTCKQPESKCPGHFGYFDLTVPVLHPMFSSYFIKLCNSICYTCHNAMFKPKEVIKAAFMAYSLHIGNEILYNRLLEFDYDYETEVQIRDEAIEEDTLTGYNNAIWALFKSTPEYSKKNQSTHLKKEYTDNVLGNVISRKKCPNCNSKVHRFRIEQSYKVTYSGQIITPLQLLQLCEKSTGKGLFVLHILLNTCKINLDLLRALCPDEQSKYTCTLPESTIWYNKFFLDRCLIVPTLFRPIQVINAIQSEHPLTIAYRKIMEVSQLIPTLTNLKCLVHHLVLQCFINQIYDGAKSISKVTLSNDKDVFSLNSTLSSTSGVTTQFFPGLKQLLEKKEGLLRSNCMGKRVNFAARSVISPDPFIKSTEIGVPFVFATTLTFTEQVTPSNLLELQKCILNGPSVHPGAVSIKVNNYEKHLQSLSKEERQSIALSLNQDMHHKQVKRHIRNGDLVLMNRQPTLHKNSMMAHTVKLLKNEKTIRMHYINCNSYNADYDGDEMNLHFPQSLLGQSEALHLAHTSLQYLVPTDGEPLRGFIQDHIVSAVKLTNKDTFLLLPDVCHLLSNHSGSIPCPAILKPTRLWTGKQIISCLIQLITPDLCLTSTCKTKETVLIHNSQMLDGSLDKSQIGPSKNGLVHMLFNHTNAAQCAHFMDLLSSTLSTWLTMVAHSCCIKDLLLTSQYDNKRLELLRTQDGLANEALSTVPSNTLKSLKPVDIQVVDTVMKSTVNQLTSQLINQSLPNGLLKHYPKNNFQLMTMTGAKGSNVNASQISCCLGQQELEGKRPPLMPSHKSLPGFEAYSQSCRAGGFIGDRFLSGIRPQEYYYHCMAGREGLIDTAVKTARSGYLQRCLMKHLEDLMVCYDGTVRNANGDVYQFLYGEDGIDVCKALKLKTIVASAVLSDANIEADISKPTKAFKYLKKSLKKDKYDVCLNKYNPYVYKGSMSEAFYKQTQSENMDKFIDLYQKALVDPCESVGILAAQSIGEPSTQMTLNTFHFAGFGAKNVTLGIPRLREILMTASMDIKTPMMSIPFDKDEPKELIKLLKKITFKNCIQKVDIEQSFCPNRYGITITMNQEALSHYNISLDFVQQRLESTFMPVLMNKVEKLGKDDDLETENMEVDDGHAIMAKFERIKLFKWNDLELKVVIESEDVRMMELVEESSLSILREIKGIEQGYCSQNQDNEQVLIIEGNNIAALWDTELSTLRMNEIDTNDVYKVLELYGVEAARACIVKEIKQVFDVYGIGVDNRHLFIIADYMTHEGGYKAFNRIGLSTHASTLLKMSYETTCKFLQDSVLFDGCDDGLTPSGAIVLGNTVKAGTGYFDVLME